MKGEAEMGFPIASDFGNEDRSAVGIYAPMHGLITIDISDKTKDYWEDPSGQYFVKQKDDTYFVGMPGGSGIPMFGPYCVPHEHIEKAASISFNFYRPDANGLYEMRRTSNVPMLHADISGIAENRYRDCIDCDKSFKKPHEGEYRCESCRAKVLEDERRDRAGKQLLDANARIKP